VRQEQFRLESRRIDPFLGEKIAAALDDFQDRHGIKICFMTQVPSSKLEAMRLSSSCCRFIQQGKVALESGVGDRGTILIQTIGAGEVLGWSWLFPPYYWHFDARALEPTRAIFFYGTRLREYCEEDHDLGYDLIKRMAQVVLTRLQATRRQLLEV